MSIRRSFIAVSVVLLALAACSNDDEPSGGSTGAASPTSAPTETESSTPSASESATSGGETEVETENSALGTILVDSSGNTLYVFLQDTDGTSTCYDDCAANWPAFVAKGELKSGGGGEDVDEALLGTTERDDGTTQVTFNGHPLYSLRRRPGRWRHERTGRGRHLVRGLAGRGADHGMNVRTGASVIGSGLWKTASTLLPCRSFTNAA